MGNWLPATDYRLLTPATDYRLLSNAVERKQDFLTEVQICTVRVTGCWRSGAPSRVKRSPGSSGVKAPESPGSMLPHEWVSLRVRNDTGEHRNRRRITTIAKRDADISL